MPVYCAVEALYTAFLYLADRHSLMRSHFELENVAGPQVVAKSIKQFQLPFAYTDLRCSLPPVLWLPQAQILSSVYP